MWWPSEQVENDVSSIRWQGRKFPWPSWWQSEHYQTDIFEKGFIAEIFWPL